MESQPVIAETPELDHLLEYTSFRVYMLALPKRVKKNSVFCDTNYKSFFEPRILFNYKTLSHNVAASTPNAKISQRLLASFLNNCKHLRSSTSRSRIFSLINVAKEQAAAMVFNFKFLEANEKLVKLQHRIYREEEYRQTSVLEGSLSSSLDRYTEELQDNLYYRKPDSKVAQPIFDLLAHSYTEEQVIEQWRKALIRNVLRS